jgi:drug/metabolite transporter (DMT)-like permease
LVLAFGAVYLIWGSTYLGIKYALESWPPFLMSGLRFTVAGIILYLWSGREEHGEAGCVTRPSVAQWWAAAIGGGLFFLCGNAGVVWAEKYISSGLAALLVASEPFWIILLNWALPGGKRPTGKILLGMLVGLVGVWLLFCADGQGESNWLGILLTLGASFAWAAGSVYATRAALPTQPALASGMQMLAGGVLLLLASVVTGEWMGFAPAAISAQAAWALVYLTVCGAVVAFTAYQWLLRATTPARAGGHVCVRQPGRGRAARLGDRW